MFMSLILSLKVPSVRMERSWNRKKIPGLRCSSFNRAAFAESGPTSVRVYECRGRDVGTEELDDDSLVDELGGSLEALGIVRGGGGG